MNYKICWLTLNHACNLQCKWCYAKDTKYSKNDDIDIEIAKDIINICSDLKIPHITLIGGEPTIYPHLKEVILYCHSKNISCGIVTNGIKLADEDFLHSMFEVDQKSFSISLKGENKGAFKATTGKDMFDTALKGISNCLKNGINPTVSMVLTEENIDSFIEGVKTLKDIGVKRFHFSFCYEFAVNADCKKQSRENNPKKLVKKFMEHYPKLDQITEGNFVLFETFPLCIWDMDFINLMNNKNQIKTVCQLLHRSGLIFDPKGNLLPCNAMPSIKLGKLHNDFSTAKELLEFSETLAIKRTYNKLCSVPDITCLECANYDNCGGGCVCHWTNYNFDTLQKMEI